MKTSQLIGTGLYMIKLFLNRLTESFEIPKKQSMEKKPFLATFLWKRFTCFKAAEPLRGSSLIPGTHLDLNLNYYVRLNKYYL